MKAIEIEVTKPETILSAKNIIDKEQGRLDILINNAAISGVKFDENGNFISQTRTATETSIDTFKEVYETNVYGVAMLDGQIGIRVQQWR